MKKTTFFKLICSFLYHLFCESDKSLKVLVSHKLLLKHLSTDNSFYQPKRVINKLIFSIIFLIGFISVAQVAAPFTPRLPGGSIKVKGDVVLIGNQIITAKGLSLPYTGSSNNNSYEGVYVNVASGGDPNIFSSSSADLDIDNSCKKILYAGLYWASVYPNEIGDGSSFGGTQRYDDWNEIKFKLPTGGFIDLVADNDPDPSGEEDDIIFDGYDYSNINNSFKDSPIICYKNVTGLLQGLTESNGEYTVANVRATRGKRIGGCSAGWTLVVVYESPTLPSKFITLFDGYAGVKSGAELPIPISGFQTLPSPLPVNANLGVAALEGDIGLSGDSFQFKASTSGSFTRISDALNSSSNFFNSRITRNGVHVLNRNPASTNTLGLDINDVKLPNPGNIVLPNDATDGDLKLTTSGDGYGAFLATFSVEIIEPKITLTKIVEDPYGNDISNAVVNLGDELNYVIGFQNTGNDDAKNLIIRDILPNNIDFDISTDLEALPSGVTIQSYDPINREIIFAVDDNVVKQNDPVKEIRFKVSVVTSCSLLNDACDNIVSNQAYVTYNGTVNSDFAISDDPSYSTNTGCLITPAATNFLADLDDCIFEEEVILCGASTELRAGDGYDSYSWSTSPTGTPVIGDTQSITVTEIGTYYVNNTALAPCQSSQQIFEVKRFGTTVDNPVLPYADEVVTCPNDGKKLPNIFMCGANDTRLIQTGISDTSSMIWEKLNESSCTAVVNQDCANEGDTCAWVPVGSGPDFLVDTSGQYRLTLNYSGGCFNQFYFNVYTNLLVPTVSSHDIVCTTLGEITVGGVPSGYEYSIDGVNYQDENVFSISTPDVYTVYVKQKNVSPNPCIFTVPDVQIRQRNFTVSKIIEQPFCNGDKGNIILAANDARPQYTFTISQGATVVNSTGLIVDGNYVFENLNPGIYTVDVTTEDGCAFTDDIEIIEPDLLTATSALTKPITCTDGEITVYPVGGTAPYFYFVNSSTEFQTEPEIVVTTSGVYDITVVDSNNCTTETSITVNQMDIPDFTVNSIDLLCYGSNAGEIEFNVTDANGYAIEYSIDDGASYSATPIFSNLEAGTYQTIIKYSIDGYECFSTAQEIIITQPDETLTASSGVSELAGCGPSGEGKIRITNPQGGTPFSGPNPYEYSFDNQATWVTTNEATVMPGNYTLYIRDANGCIYSMPNIVLNPEPVAPTITVDDPIFNCDGTAGTTVTITNPGSDSFTYNYFLDGVENPNTSDPKTFLNVPEGSHTITVEYVLSTVPTYSNLLYETFGYGEDTSSPGINPTYYCFERQVAATQCKNSISINDGDYSVTANIVSPFGSWMNPVDHTPQTTPPTPKGRYLVVNIGATIPATEILYEKMINDIIPNQPINVEFFAMNLLKSGNQYDPNLTVALVDGSGSEISSFNTGEIPKSQVWENYPKTPMTLDPGSNTSLKFIVRSNVQQTNGNDVAIDDIRVFQLPEVCTTQVEFPFFVNSGNAFTAEITGYSDVTCTGANTGTIVIAAQNFDATNGYQYSIDNGVNWITQTTSPYTITGLSAGTYDVLIRYDDTSTGCEYSFTPTISEPTSLGVDVDVTPATCLTGATITATGTGGTAAYTYELLDDVTLNLVSDFPQNGVLTNVSTGDYVIRVTDSNGCTATSLLSLTNPSPPTATIETTSDLCYDINNGATLEVLASGGQTPYEYRINGGSFGPSNVFDNLTPGNYDITVRDANGCEFDLATQTIAEQLLVSTILTKDLDCTVSPDAVITGTISGGYAPYTYEVSINGAAFASLGSAGTPFTYSTPNDGTYQFKITDAQGCEALSTVTTVNVLTLPEINSVTEVQSILCHGGSDAAILVDINNTVGTPAFTINVYNNTTSTDYGTQTSGLPAGEYIVTLTDDKSCEDTETITITEPDPLVLDYDVDPITCNEITGESLGKITINSVIGGTHDYTYHITGNGIDEAFTGQTGGTQFVEVVDFGLYEIIITDANGCSEIVQDVLVASPPDDLEININTVAVDCLTGGTAEISVGTPLAGSGPYYFAIYTGLGMTYPGVEWQAEDPLNPGQTTFDNLIPGITYTFIVYDSYTGCYYYETADIAVETNSELIVDAVTSNNITCKGSADGNVSFDITSTYATDTNVSYEVLNSLTLAPIVGVSGVGVVPASGTLSVTDLGPLPFGNYIVVVTEGVGADNEGCNAVTETPFNITESAIPLSISTSITKNANCNPDSGVISAIGKDGTAPYTYQLTTSSTAPAATDANWDSTSVFNVGAGTYYIYVKDAYGCIVSGTETVVEDPTPVVAASVNTQCNVAEGDFSIDVTLPTSGITPHSFSINGGAFQVRTTPFTIDNLSSGTHTIEVQDANGCGNLVTVEIEQPLGLTSKINALATCYADDGEISVTAYGGTGNYSYEIISPIVVAAQPSNIFTGLADGTYTIRVNDTSTGCNTEVIVTLIPPTPVTFTTSTTDVTCNGGNDGTITVTLPVTNDNPIYTYEITAPAASAVGPQTSNVFAGLSAGTYTVQVNSGRGCIATEDVVVSEAVAITIDATSVVEYACSAGLNAVNYASISVSTVSGGSGTYTNYEFIKGGTILQFGPQTTYTETDFSGGTYTINVYDDKGCLGTTTETITPFTSLETLSVVVDTDITCTNDEDITVSVTSTGPTPTNLEFVVEDIDASGTLGGIYSATNATGVFTGLPIGNYSIIVTNLDTNCTLQTVHYVNDPNTFDLTIDSVVDVTCFGDNNGSVDVTFVDRTPTPTDNSGPFDYTIEDSLGNPVTSGTILNAGPATINGLTAGIYTITATLTNTPFCTVAKNFTISEPSEALAITETHTEITCVSGNNDGSISVSATGGWPGAYQYQLATASGTVIVPFGDVFNFTGLVEDDYIVSVEDGRGCIATIDVRLVNPPPIVVTLVPDALMLDCFGDTDGRITVNATGGQGSNYTYTLNSLAPTVSSSGPQISNIFDGLPAGTYNVSVTDGYNCSSTSDDIIIEEPNQVKAALVLETSQTCEVESLITLSATGGTGDYEYSETASFASILGTFTTSTTFQVPVGTYQYYVRDTNGCTASVSNQITIDPLADVTVELEVINSFINCAGDMTGAFTATASGGLGNYIYTLQDETGTDILPAPIQSSPGVFADLPAGTYQVQVDSDDCSGVSEQITITEPANALSLVHTVTDVTCSGENNGRLEITASGGTGEIRYAISPQLNQFFETSIFENLSPGIYQAMAQDEYGCFVLIDFEIEEPSPVMVNIVPNSIFPEICQGDENGEFSIDISGGTMPYSVALDDDNGAYLTGGITQTQFDFTGLVGGDHIVYVVDALGCESEWNITFPESVLIESEVDVEFGCINNLSTNTVTVKVDDTTLNLSDLDYSLNGGPYQVSNVFIDVAPGIDHYIDVRHTNGCIKRTELFDIAQYNPLQLVLEDGELNEIVAVATGGTGTYEYAINGEPYVDTNTFLIYASGDYTVTVTDSNGCVASATRYFEFIDVCIPNYFTPNTEGWGPGCTSQYKALTVDVFDRYGRKIATLKVDEKWDGRYNGKELPTGDYWYILKLNDEKYDRDFVGHFTLYR
ncbi:T9SS type B sorting domain-containing protein [Pseudalgibacter alginicilyticus]|nr:T9SS type B sorting domain-containing protein [Pseudalgibacter alginicilyticus]